MVVLGVTEVARGSLEAGSRRLKLQAPKLIETMHFESTQSASGVLEKSHCQTVALCRCRKENARNSWHAFAIDSPWKPTVRAAVGEDLRYRIEPA